jgi:hypothetical protein
MAQTFFRDTKRDDGTAITVEFSYAHGSETTYSPRYGADGGDPPEAEIICAFLTDGAADSPNLDLTEDERERIENEIYAAPPEYDDSDLYD